MIDSWVSVSPSASTITNFKTPTSKRLEINHTPSEQDTLLFSPSSIIRSSGRFKSRETPINFIKTKSSSKITSFSRQITPFKNNTSVFSATPMFTNENDYEPDTIVQPKTIRKIKSKFIMNQIFKKGDSIHLNLFSSTTDADGPFNLEDNDIDELLL